MKTVTVTIGRNVPAKRQAAALLDGVTDGTALTDAAWSGFTSQITEALEQYAVSSESPSWWIETHDGLGEWDGVPEESRKITLLLDQAAEPSPLNRASLELSLIWATAAYHNDAVALSYGDSKLLFWEGGE